MAETIADTRRLMSKPQNLNDAYGPPSNFLEIDVSNPQTVGVGRGRFTTYEIRVKVRWEGRCPGAASERAGVLLLPPGGPPPPPRVVSPLPRRVGEVASSLLPPTPGWDLLPSPSGL